MKRGWRFGIAVCVIGNALLRAQNNPPSDQQAPAPASPSETSQAGEPLATPADFCTHNKGPHCVTPPQVLLAPTPAYSREAMSLYLQGVCVLSAIIGTDGRVHDPKVLRGLGSGLDEEALKALGQWLMKPARRDGKPVAAQIEVEMTFRLNASVNVSPTSAQVVAGKKQKFTANMSGPATWSVTGPGCVDEACGTISDRGVYTAPNTAPNPPTVIVMVVSVRNSSVNGAAKVTIKPNPHKK